MLSFIFLIVIGVDSNPNCQQLPCLQWLQLGTILVVNDQQMVLKSQLVAIDWGEWPMDLAIFC